MTLQPLTDSSICGAQGRTVGVVVELVVGVRVGLGVGERVAVEEGLAVNVLVLVLV